jgi:hypothetical protein
MSSPTLITFNIDPAMHDLGYYWNVIRVGMRAVGSIAKNLDSCIDKDYYLQVHDSFGNTIHAEHYKTVADAKEAFLAMPIGIMPVG